MMLFTTAFALSLLAPALPEFPSRLSADICDVGERRQFESATCDIELRNGGDVPIHIFNTAAVSSVDRIEPSEIVVPPHGVGYLKATVKYTDGVGFVHRRFSFQTDEAKSAPRVALVQGFVTTVLDDAKPTIDFENVNLDGDLPSRSVTLGAREMENFKILGVIAKPNYVDVRVDEGGKTVTATLEKTAPWGLIEEPIKLKINAPQGEAWIRLKANVSGDVAADSNPFALGTMRTDKKNEFLIRLSSRSGKDFKIGDVKLERIKGKVSVAPCAKGKAGCALLKLRVSNEQTQGMLGGRLLVDLPELKRELPISLVGMLLSPDMPIHDLNEAKRKKLDAQGGGESPVEDPAVLRPSIANAIKEAVNDKMDEDVPPAGNGPLLRWSVANDNTVYGYVVYRAESEGGPFHRVNEHTIRATKHDGPTAKYQWRDNSAEPRKDHWYAIDALKNDGQKQPLGAPQKFAAKTDG